MTRLFANLIGCIFFTGINVYIWHGYQIASRRPALNIVQQGARNFLLGLVPINGFYSLAFAYLAFGGVRTVLITWLLSSRSPRVLFGGVAVVALLIAAIQFRARRKCRQSPSHGAIE